jgi:drug/metabolite transporter (DMT)-like permease
LFGSLAGFLLYYQVLKAFSATMSSFMTLLAPSLALIWGTLLNHEPITEHLMIGALFILMGLAVFILIPAEKAR